MSRALNRADTLGFGFMILAFFLGAGNWIFPPMAGQLAGANLLPAMLGFLLTAVGLPLLGILALAAAQGGLERLGRFLPGWLALAIALAIYLVMVPGFGIPRTAAVSFGMTVKPFLAGQEPGWRLTAFSLLFFTVATLIALNPHRILDRIGKMIAPLMLILVALLGLIVLFAPQGPIGPTAEAWQQAAFLKGFVEGYGTMDLLAAFLFGVLFINTVKEKGATCQADQHRSLLRAGLIAGGGLALVYIILFFIGVTSHAVAPEAKDGIEILAHYMDASLGVGGRIIVAAVITLACLTTAIGGMSSFAEFLEARWPTLRYRPTLICIALVCATVANVELFTLIKLFVPVLFAMYPVAIVLMVLNLAAVRLPNPRLTFTLAVSSALLFGCIDALQLLYKFGVSGVPEVGNYFGWLPLFEHNMGWLVPTGVIALLSFFVSRRGEAGADMTSEC